MSEQRKQSFGEKAVGLDFNPSGDQGAHWCKARCAALIDQMNDLRASANSPEQARHAALAITAFEDAQMRAVKALTWRAA
ncbi:MAG: hypothetical protein JSS14_21915 [Proteobacteria bacterium]|nr:hypothetical protein [Pseudomonadota bacterium]